MRQWASSKAVIYTISWGQVGIICILSILTYKLIYSTDPNTELFEVYL